MSYVSRRRALAVRELLANWCAQSLLSRRTVEASALAAPSVLKLKFNSLQDSWQWYAKRSVREMYSLKLLSLAVLLVGVLGYSTAAVCEVREEVPAQWVAMHYFTSFQEYNIGDGSVG